MATRLFIRTCHGRRGAGTACAATASNQPCFSRAPIGVRQSPPRRGRTTAAPPWGREQRRQGGLFRRECEWPSFGRYQERPEPRGQISGERNEDSRRPGASNCPRPQWVVGGSDGQRWPYGHFAGMLLLMANMTQQNSVALKQALDKTLVVQSPRRAPANPMGTATTRINSLMVA
jgi:hypothetical protein